MQLAKADYSVYGEHLNLSTGCRSMALLGSSQDCPPAEALHPSQGGPSLGALRASKMRGFSLWYVASWNVKTLVDVEGSIETVRHGCHVSVVDERKIDQFVSKLDRYNVDVVALQQTKWFGNVAYNVGRVLC